jgi:hypothetical protein
MTTSVKMARAAAAAFGLPERTVLLHLKHVRAAEGAISFKGHGKGAAAMGPRDAAGLVIAVAGSAYAANAADTYSAFADLRALKSPRPERLVEHLEEFIAALRHDGSPRPPSDVPEFAGNPNVLAEASLKLTWVEGAVGLDRPRIATVRRFLPRGGHTQRSFASLPLDRRYYDEARLMGEFAGIRLTTTRTVSLRALMQVAVSL